MATPASRPGPNGSSTAPSNPPTPRARDWSSLRSAEPGSAFRGLSRGRGGARPSGRGGRGGGRSTSAQSNRGAKAPAESSEKTETLPRKPDVTPPKPQPLSTGKVTPQPTPTKNTADMSPSTPSQKGRPPRPKPASRRPSHTVPAVVVAPASPTTATGPQSATSPRPTNRRRRSNRDQQGKGSSNNTAKVTVSTVSSQTSQASLRPQKVQTGPPSPVIPLKDAPPHLVIAHQGEMRHDIDALVERVRAVAMADHRPTTPGSHIDWAGDDDDSLPDLDDWGVTTTSKSNAEKQEEISPILVDTLKPLPEPQLIEEAVPGKNTNESTSPGKTDGPSPLPPSPPSSLPTSSFEDDTGDILPTPKSKMSASSSDSGAVKALSDTGDGATAPPPRLPLHPSLPPKPVAAVETLKARLKPRGNHARPNLPQKPALAATTVAEPAAEPVAEPVVNSNDGLAQSIHAPTAAEVAQKEQQRLTEEQGLGASIHAPKGLADINTANHSALGPTPSRVFNPSHNRSRTVGRPPSFQQPFTAPASLASGRVTRSGASSPLGPNGLTHARTHSSPPSSGPASRARPVITGDAISRLARTIGGAPRAVGVSAVAKE